MPKERKPIEHRGKEPEGRAIGDKLDVAYDGKYEDSGMSFTDVRQTGGSFTAFTLEEVRTKLTKMREAFAKPNYLTPPTQPAVGEELNNEVSSAFTAYKTGSETLIPLRDLVKENPLAVQHSHNLGIEQLEKEGVTKLYRAGEAGVSWTTDKEFAERFAEDRDIATVQEIDLTDNVKSRILLYERTTPAFEGAAEMEVILLNEPIIPTPPTVTPPAVGEVTLSIGDVVTIQNPTETNKALIGKRVKIQRLDSPTGQVNASFTDKADIKRYTGKYFYFNKSELQAPPAASDSFKTLLAIGLPLLVLYHFLKKAINKHS